MRSITDEERRARLAMRHRLTPDARTDDVTAVLRAFPDVTVAWVEGDRRTLKVTHPDDLAVVRALAAAGDADPG